MSARVSEDSRATEKYKMKKWWNQSKQGSGSQGSLVGDEG